MSRLLTECGHEVIVANSRQLRLIYENPSKDDRVDALYLARLARLDPALLAPVTHRSATAQEDLALLRSRDALVSARTGLINHVRGVVKSVGGRLPACSSRSFPKKVSQRMPESLRLALWPVVEEIASLGDRINKVDKQLEALCEESYPQTKLLRQVRGVGPITSLAFVLTLEDPGRFQKSRTVGAFLGLVPGRRQSGGSDPQRRITKQGDESLRRLLVNASQYLLGPLGADCDLRRFGLRIASGGGKFAKKRAVIAVARKLAGLLHHLWRSGEIYEPFYQENHKAGRRAKVAWPSTPVPEQTHLRKTKLVNSTDPETLRVHRPVPATATSSLGPPTADSMGRGEVGSKMAAPRLDGPQHAPSQRDLG